jgi:hypothetical protein
MLPACGETVVICRTSARQEVVVPLSLEHARAGGLYKKHYAHSHGVGLADAIIAATAEAENAELKTLNTKHYPMIKGLKPAYPQTS